jgi:hypothetical protein
MLPRAMLMHFIVPELAAPLVLMRALAAIKEHPAQTSPVQQTLWTKETKPTSSAQGRRAQLMLTSWSVAI